MILLKAFKGFTLVELLLALLIMSTVMSLVVGIVWLSLRSTVKVNNLSTIRQNGNSVILQLSKILQFSKSFQGVSNNGTDYTTSCDKPGAGPLVQYRYVRFTGFDNGVTTLRCNPGLSTISSNSASLINTASFAVSNCHFTCTQVNGNSPYTIGLQFKLSKITNGSIFDSPAPLDFKTSVTLRNSAFP